AVGGGGTGRAAHEGWPRDGRRPEGCRGSSEKISARRAGCGSDAGVQTIRLHGIYLKIVRQWDGDSEVNTGDRAICLIAFNILPSPPLPGPVIFRKLDRS